MPARTTNAHPRHREILDVAARLFQHKGYAATSIQEIADELGILKGSLYYHIDSKEDLLFEIIQDVHTSSLEGLATVRSFEGDALEKIAELIKVQVANASVKSAWGRVFFEDFRLLSDERKRLIVEERDTYEYFVRDLVQEGQRDGVICPDLDAKLSALAIVSVFNLMYRWYRPEGDRTPDQIAAGLIEFVLPALSCDRATHVPGHRTARPVVSP